MPNNYLSVLNKHIIQVENKNVGLKVGGWGGTNIPLPPPIKNVGGGGAHAPLDPPPPTPLPKPVYYIYSVCLHISWPKTWYCPYHFRRPLYVISN